MLAWRRSLSAFKGCVIAACYRGNNNCNPSTLVAMPINSEDSFSSKIYFAALTLLTELRLFGLCHVTSNTAFAAVIARLCNLELDAAETDGPQVRYMMLTVRVAIMHKAVALRALFLPLWKWFLSNKFVALCVWEKYGAIMQGDMRNLTVSNYWSILRSIGFSITYRQKGCVLLASSAWSSIRLACLNWKCWCSKIRW